MDAILVRRWEGDKRGEVKDKGGYKRNEEKQKTLLKKSYQYATQEPVFRSVKI